MEKLKHLNVNRSTFLSCHLGGGSCPQLLSGRRHQRRKKNRCRRLAQDWETEKEEKFGKAEKCDCPGEKTIYEWKGNSDKPDEKKNSTEACDVEAMLKKGGLSLF